MPSWVALRFGRTRSRVQLTTFLAESEFLKEVIKRRREVEVENRTIWLVSPEDLVLLKLLAGRPRDLGDVTDVLFMQGQIDLQYMRRWADVLGVAAELERRLAEMSLE